MTIRMLPTAGSPPTLTVNGRPYSVSPGSVLDIPDHDAVWAGGNGWEPALVNFEGKVGTTAQRPTRQANGLLLATGTLYLDTTLSVVALWDGAAWRNVLSGAA